MKKSILFFVCIFILSFCFAQNDSVYKEMYRPQIHFSPKAHWMNDPNGMVYSEGVYHLFFQYYPGGNVWGPMHWGHATSADMIHWKEQPIALYPDSIGYIFSGSAVIDKNNTSGFGKNGKPSIVAIFTQHDPVGEKEKNNVFQNQSIAYSIDNGKTFIKYNHNPVLKNPGVSDFRDPKVMWYGQQHKWIMTLATKNCVTFYSSVNLKEWKKESEFGKTIGAHGGVWECPDLFSFDDKGKIIWVLIVNVNPGGPNGGSATQYFVGDFDGETFTPYSTKIKWLDYGPDEYAGVTWSNTGNRKIFLGWMSNWLYANIVPTSVWRNAMTIPRELKLKHEGNDVFVASEPVKELDKIASTPLILKNVQVNKSFDLSSKINSIKLPCRIDIDLNNANDFSIVSSNDTGEKIVIGYDKQANYYFIDRTQSGNVDFYQGFAAKHFAPRISKADKINISLIIDVSSVELFADDGLTVMTEIFFPSKPYNHIIIQSKKNILVDTLKYVGLKNIWNK